jgi:hypothetical protein
MGGEGGEANSVVECVPGPGLHCQHHTQTNPKRSPAAQAKCDGRFVKQIDVFKPCVMQIHGFLLNV